MASGVLMAITLTMFFVILAILLVFYLLTDEKEKPKPEPLFCLNVQPFSSSEEPLILKMLKELNCYNIRASWWAWCSDDPNGPHNWCWYPKLKRQGIEVLPVVYPHPEDTEIGKSIAARYKVLHDTYGPFPFIQLDNEIDGWALRDVTDSKVAFEIGRKWAEQMKIAMEEIGKFQPFAKFVTGGVAWNQPKVQDFVAGLISIGEFDVLAIHTYGVHIYGEPLTRGMVVRELGWNGPIWVTEWGVSDIEARWVEKDSEVYQEENWWGVLSRDESRHLYDRMYGFQLTPSNENWGIRNKDWTPRRAYLWLKEWRHGK